MDSVIDKIQELDKINLITKHDKLVNGIINAIDDKIIQKGDILPSVNVMVNELGFARKTIVKAYSDLKERGLIESKNRLGYYVANESTEQTIKIALVLYAFHSFQEEFYNTFRNSLQGNVQLDIFFHHNNREVFDSIISNISSKYGMYVIAPVANNRNKIKTILENFPPNKLLIVDRYLNIGSSYSYVSQRFRKPMYEVLNQLEPTLKSFKKFVLFYKENTDYPNGIHKAFKQFMNEKFLDYDVRDNYERGELEKGTVYFSINDNDLWRLIKDCKEQNVVMGKEIGILSHNDNIIKEFIHGGISTFSTDFKIMAETAARFVNEKKFIQEIVPSILIRRASL